MTRENTGERKEEAEVRYGHAGMTLEDVGYVVGLTLEEWIGKQAEVG